MTDEETYKGALQRARNAKQSLPEGVHYWVGLEGGVQNFDPTGELLSFGWAVVLSSRSERIGTHLAIQPTQCNANRERKNSHLHFTPRNSNPSEERG
uniref:inosine/xanthosine triphosphatase n=1 Tax=Arcella intermedia TaxID=1963864 RepID=A0A6B2LQ86_9EUKA